MKKWEVGCEGPLWRSAHRAHGGLYRLQGPNSSRGSQSAGITAVGMRYTPFNSEKGSLSPSSLPLESYLLALGSLEWRLFQAT